MKRLAVGASLAVTLLVSGVMAGDAIKSGPQLGDKVIVPFNPLHVNGDTAGQKVCLV
jgi:hypothetical protein